MIKNNIIDNLLGKRRFILFATLPFIYQAAFAAIIPGGRMIAWNPGVPGGVPNRTTVYQTIPAGASMSTIQSALNSCPSNQVVKLSAGTYNLTGSLIIPSYVTLQGSGRNSTILNLTGSSGYGAIEMGALGNWATGSHTTISSGATAGSASVVVASASGISVGSYLKINALNDTYVTSNGTGWTDAVDGTRNQAQIVEVTSVNGTTIGFTPALYVNYQNRSPWAYPFNAATKYAGVESLKVTANNTGYGANFYMCLAAYCWVKDVEGDFADGDHVNIHTSYRCEVRDSYFHDGFNHGPGGHDDDVLLAHTTTACLIENNSFWRMHASVMLQYGPAGNVIAYNYSTNNYHETWLSWCINDFDACHGSHPMFNLYEGNIGVQFRLDRTWGSSSHNTMLRNWFAGSDYYAPPLNARSSIQWGSGSWENANTYAFSIDDESVTNNLVGNIAGSSWQVANGGTYLVSAPSANSPPTCFRFGFHSDTDAPVSNLQLLSSILHGNWDFVTRSQHWDASISDHTIPSSYYLTAKPSWFGACPWPPVDPGSPSSLAITNLPAGYRFVYGVNPPAGGPVNQAPVALANASPKSGPAPLAVTFSSAGSSDPEGTPLTYSWTFGDGATATTANPNHTYTLAGAFAARLTVSDGTNATTSTNLTITVSVAGSNYPPVAAASATPTVGASPLTVSFSSTGSSDPEGAALTYAWTFGDGSTSTTPSPTHTYQATGIYTAQLAVSDGTNRSLSSIMTITVANASGLVAAYGFEEGVGSTVTDASGYGNTGTISGASRTTGGRFGSALSFNGTNSLVTINDSAPLDVTSGLTLEAWVYPTSLSGNWMNLIFKGNPNSGSVLSYVLQGSAPQGQVPSFYCSAASGNLMGNSPLPLGVWSHLAATYDGAAMRFYVNGVLVASQAQTGAIAASTDPLTIGGNAYYPESWAGLIDEVRVYNRGLSASEVLSDMNTAVTGIGGRPVPPSPPQGLRVVSQ